MLSAERVPVERARRVLEPEREVTQFDWSGCFMAEHLYPKDFPATVVANLTNAYVQVRAACVCIPPLGLPC